MIALLAVFGLVGAALFPTGRHLGRGGYLIAGLPPLATLVWLVARLPRVLDGEVVTQHITWVRQLGIAIDLRLDGFAALMVLLVAGIGVVVFVYAAAYFRPTARRRPGTPACSRCSPASMLGLVLADNLLVLYGVLGAHVDHVVPADRQQLHEDPRPRGRARRRCSSPALGGLAMLAGFVLLGAGGRHVPPQRARRRSAAGGTVVTVALVLVLVGAFTKSAQYPFHAWLPGGDGRADAGQRLPPLGDDGEGRRLPDRPARAGLRRRCRSGVPIVLIVGAVTMIAGGLRGAAPDDLKLLLAYRHGEPARLPDRAVRARHAGGRRPPAASMLARPRGCSRPRCSWSVGIVDHHAGTRDLRRIPRPRRRAGACSPIVTVVSAASMAGVPLMFGFVAKESAFDGAASTTVSVGGRGVLAAVVAGSVLTVAYAFGCCGWLFGRPAGRAVATRTRRPAHRRARRRGSSARSPCCRR